MDLHNSVVIVTGASAGIGLATARLCAAQGARLALVGRRAAPLERLADELAGTLAVPADMRAPDDIRRMVDVVLQHYGRIDILINNAGQGMHGPLVSASLENYRAMFELNVLGVVAAMQAVIPAMRTQQRGVIVNVSAGLAHLNIPLFGPYASTKAALNAVSLTARRELAPDHISVCLAHLGRTATDFMANAVGGRPSSLDTHEGPSGDTPEASAATIIAAVQSEAAETYASSLMPRPEGV